MRGKKGENKSSSQSNNCWLSVLGIGEDGYDALTADARALCAGARYILGARRHIASLPEELQTRAEVWRSPFAKNLTRLDALRDEAQARAVSKELPSELLGVCVLATGDPLSYGVGSVLVRRYGIESMRIIPCCGSFSLAAAALGWSHESFTGITLHGRSLGLLRRHLAPCARLLVMLAGIKDVSEVARLLCEEKLGLTGMTILSRLGGRQEARLNFTARDFSAACLEQAMAQDLEQDSSLALLALELPAHRDALVGSQPDALSFARGSVALVFGQNLALPEEAFFHDGQISKREVRALTISSLVIERDALLWDIGAGSGSVSIEWCLGGGRACAVERDARRVSLIKKNRERFGVPDRLEVVHSEAQDFVQDFVQGFTLARKAAAREAAQRTAPQAIFLGGCLQLALLEQLRLALAARGRLVANAVTLVGECSLMAFCDKHGGVLTRIGVERLEALGSARAFCPQRRILQYVYHAL